ncbi:MAG: prolipoprotein diacylglyceryl transferase [Anaerolineae bacterium]
MNPVLISIGPFAVTWYGLLIVTGAVLGAWVATLEAKRRGEDPEHIWNVLPWLLIAGIIGARLYHVFSNPVGGLGWSWYREHPLDIINFWSGGFRGLGIFGAVLGGFIALAIYLRIKHLNIPRWLDITIPGVLLAQALGRFGNFINQELFGPPTTLPWGFKININFPFQTPTEMLGRSPQEILDYVTVTRFHPTFFYEALWNLVGFGLVMVFGRKLYPKLRDGDIFLFYLIWYPLGRIIVEMFRPDAWISGLPGLATAQLISLAMIVVGVVGLIVRHRNWQPTPAGAAGMAGNVAAADDESAA